MSALLGSGRAAGHCRCQRLARAGQATGLCGSGNRCQRSGWLHQGLSAQGASQHQKSGGKYLAGGFNKAISLFGSPPPNRVALLQFADMDAVKAFYVKQKQIEAEVGNKYASFRVIGIDGVEQK